MQINITIIRKELSSLLLSAIDSSSESTNMTKLMEWLAALAVIVSVWLALLTGKLAGGLVKEQPLFVYCLPIFLAGIFGVYALSVVLYRTFTFNNCEKAAIELQKEIKEAKADLAQKGYTFKS